MAEGTGIVKPGSDLERASWLKEGFVQARSKSIFRKVDSLTGKGGIVQQKKDLRASDGMTVIFDYDGNLTQRPVKGKDTATGKGEKKRKFSNKLTVERYRFIVDNGDKFDTSKIDALKLNNHSDSRNSLMDLYTRWKDQTIIDTACGYTKDPIYGNIRTPSHGIDIATGGLTYNKILDLELVIRTSTGYTIGGIRRPMTPYRGRIDDVDANSDHGERFVLLLDTHTEISMRKSGEWQTMMMHAKPIVGNPLFSGVIGRIGIFDIYSMNNFFGETDGLGNGFEIHESDIEIAGIRRIDKANSEAIEGQEGFDYVSNDIWSRNLILGENAIQLAFGKQPEYKWQESRDFGITSESMMEIWYNTDKTVLMAENKDYRVAKVAGHDHGVVTLDVKN